MSLSFSEGTLLFKALADETRIQIIHILSCGELCACDILSYFDLKQPTLSHHLGLLEEANLVEVRKEGRWSHYKLNPAGFSQIHTFLSSLASPSEVCLCKQIKKPGEYASCSEKSKKEPAEQNE